MQYNPSEHHVIRNIMKIGDATGEITNLMTRSFENRGIHCFDWLDYNRENVPRQLIIAIGIKMQPLHLPTHMAVNRLPVNYVNRWRWIAFPSCVRQHWSSNHWMSHPSNQEKFFRSIILPSTFLLHEGFHVPIRQPGSYDLNNFSPFFLPSKGTEWRIKIQVME